MSTRVEVLRSMEEIRAIREHWVRMQRHPNADFDYYSLILQSIPSVEGPYVLVVWREGEPVAILVGRVERSRMSIKFGYAQVAGPRTRCLVFIYGGLLGEPTPIDCHLLMAEIMKELHRGRADRVMFNHLRTDSPLYDVILHASHGQRSDEYTVSQVHRRALLPDGVAEFRSRFSQKMRSNLKREANRLAKLFPETVRVQCYASADEMDGMLKDVEAVATRTYQRGLGAGFRDTADEVARLRCKAEKGWLRVYVLYLADQPCAFWIGTLYRGTLHSDYMGYDPEYREYSPGKYLLVRVLEEFCAQGAEKQVQVVDFGIGDAEYKRILADEEWTDASPCLFAPNLKGVALNALSLPTRYLERAGRALLSQHWEARLKRMWRRRFAHRAAERSSEAVPASSRSASNS